MKFHVVDSSRKIKGFGSKLWRNTSKIAFYFRILDFGTEVARMDA